MATIIHTINKNKRKMPKMGNDTNVNEKKTACDSKSPSDANNNTK